MRMYKAEKNYKNRSPLGTVFEDQLSYNSRIQMMETEVDLFKSDKEIGKHLKKRMNASLFIPRNVSVQEQDKVLDSVLGPYKEARINFKTTLLKHIESDGQMMPNKLSDPASLTLSNHKLPKQLMNQSSQYGDSVFNTIPDMMIQQEMAHKLSGI